MRLSLARSYMQTRYIRNLKGVEMVTMPSDKELVSTTYIEPLMTMISNIQSCTGYGKLTVNVNIKTMNVHNDHSTTNITNTTDDTDDIQAFINHIIDTKPKWYKSGKWIFIKDLFSKFVEFSESDSTINKFSREAYNKIYSKKENRRINRNQGKAALLIKYEDL